MEEKILMGLKNKNFATCEEARERISQLAENINFGTYYPTIEIDEYGARYVGNYEADVTCIFDYADGDFAYIDKRNVYSKEKLAAIVESKGDALCISPKDFEKGNF